MIVIMTAKRTSQHGQWSSRWAFILAATGSAVGLGNIWKFPYITGENGGGAFVLVYLLCICCIGVPIMIAEIMLGRRGRQSPVNTMKILAQEENQSPVWSLLGWAGVIAGFLILSYYSVIAGWALHYMLSAAMNEFQGLTAETSEKGFGDLLTNVELLLVWHTLFMVMTMFVVAKGVRGGLEKAVRLLMPSLFILLLILVGYAMGTDSFGKGVAFLFSPDFSKLNSSAVLTAMGHAFFTLSLGMGAIMVYGSYLPEKTSIARTCFIIAGADTLVALLAGLAIFPIVFEYQLTPGAGPGLIFQTLPIAFGQMPGGWFFGTLFFVLLVFAAWSSAISLIEPAVTWLVENLKMTRRRACWWSGSLTWFVGLGTVFSFNLIEKVTWFDKNFFELIDYLTANIMLPLGGLLIAVFAGWLMSQPSSSDELQMGDGVAYPLWRFLVRYVTPFGVGIVFLNAVGVIG